MPSVCTKPAENGGGARAAAAPSPPSETTLGQALAIVEKKMRNLEKRKVGINLAGKYRKFGDGIRPGIEEIRTEEALSTVLVTDYGQEFR
jgi:hypothetical protein